MEDDPRARLTTCPWRAFLDPVVRDVMDLYRSAKTGDGVHLASVRALNPPAHLWEGVQLYASAMARNIGEVQEAEAAANKRRR